MEMSRSKSARRQTGHCLVHLSASYGPAVRLPIPSNLEFLNFNSKCRIRVGYFSISFSPAILAATDEIRSYGGIATSYLRARYTVLYELAVTREILTLYGGTNFLISRTGKSAAATPSTFAVRSCKQSLRVNFRYRTRFYY